jgi:predicted ATPase/DNA-binding SARP family transcriptional activator
VVRIGLLGGVCATSDDGEPIDVGPAKSQTLLAALALTPGAPLPVPRLVELVWHDAPPRTAAKSLQWHVARLRRSLGPATIARAGAAYRLDVPPGAVDVTRFQQCLRDGDPAGALAHWGGAPLAGLDAPGLASAVAGLNEQWLTAVEADLRRRIDADPHASVVVSAQLTDLAQHHPLREGIWALLMTALYRAGRQAEALAAYQRARRHLVAQLGIEPGPALRELEARILAHDERLRLRAASVVADRVSGLIGRDHDVQAIVAALARFSVITLVGPGGIGKTRLALAAAHHAGGDGWLVELAEITAPADVARAAADVLGVVQQPGQTLTGSIVAALRSRRGLLVVDNCEHVLDEAARLVQAIAAGCSQVRVLTTTRERLALAEEQVHVVAPLHPAAGAELFHTRAGAADPGYEPHAHRTEVDELCRRLDGLPLAIELAAARAASHRPGDLLARLDDRRPATGARRSGTPRHRTLQTAIQWSYDLLTPAERAVFHRLSVFPGAFDLSAAGAVAGATEPPDVDDVLGSLVARSMLTVAFGPAGRRFRLLETMRQFAGERLRESGHAESTAARHAHWSARWVADVQHLLTGPSEIDGVARLTELWPDLRAAVGWACATGDIRLADMLVRPVVTELPLRGRLEVGVWAGRILAATPADEADLRSFWFLWAAEHHVQSAGPGAWRPAVDAPDRPLSRYAHAYAAGDGDALRRHLPDAAAELRRQHQDGLASFLDLMSAGTLLGIGRFEQVDASLAGWTGPSRTGAPPTLRHWALQTLAYSASFQGRRADADRYFTAAAHIDLPAGTLSANKAVEARDAFRRGQRDRAFQLLQSYADDLADTGNVVAVTVVAVEFVAMTAAAGRLTDAAAILGYLRAANDFGALAARTLVANAADRITAAGLPVGAAGMNDRAALDYMRTALGSILRR